MRGQTTMLVLFRFGLRAHLLSSHEESRQRRAKGSSLGAPDGFDFKGHCGTPQWRVTGPNARRFRVSFRGRPEVLSMKIDSDADTRTGLYTERGCGPRGWGCCIFSVSHPPYPGGPRPPPCIALVQESTFPPVFFSGKPAGRPTPEPAFIQKEAAAPEDGAGHKPIP